MLTTQLFRGEKNTLAFAAGQKIFGEGEDGDQMFVVVSGRIKLNVHGTTVELLEEGCMFGEMALIGKEPRSATALAETDSVVAVINAERFMFLVQQTPFFALQLMEVMADRLRRMDSRLEA